MEYNGKEITFDSLYEKFDELCGIYGDRKVLKDYIESMSRKTSEEEVDVASDNLPDVTLTFEEFKTILPAVNKKLNALVVDISYILGIFKQNNMLEMAIARMKKEWGEYAFIDEFISTHDIPFCS